jgi:signal transduction histidine kinase
MREKLSWLARREIEPEDLYRLTDLQTKAVERAAHPPRLSAIEASDREDEMGEWLQERGVQGAFDLAPIFVAGGLDIDWAQDVVDSVEPHMVESSLRWLGYTVETEQLMAEIEDSVTRISTLVGSARQYSQLDRTPYQPVDIHAGLEATLVMLTGKLKTGIRVVKDYAEDLPQIPGYAAELNQVWTNMIDNAVHAMDGEGTLTLRTAREGDTVLVEIGDDGPGIPPESRSRVFEPFFTTKAVGQGTGLGLDISYRIVVNRHRGDIVVESRPGDTRFQVRLPVDEPSLAVRAALDPEDTSADQPTG